MPVRNMTRCAVFAGSLCLCAWIALPVGNMAVTLQTLALFLSLGVLGGRLGTITCGVYLLLGAVGLPVFSGFRGGIGMLLGTTGGYLVGFLAAALVYWLTTTLFSKAVLPAFILGQLACYTLGTLWYSYAYLQGNFTGALLQCVLPYLIPDGIKILAAWILSKRLRITPPSGT